MCYFPRLARSLLFILSMGILDLLDYEKSVFADDGLEFDLSLS